ncbi:helix-turn-helix transcriptional regulator [Vibrio vulnificus]|uniref:helix-turn-helix domain-containing protein n=1 Tax=Vibrio vulnificus TaxID=672 RepID=UPI0013EE997A|nr:helix-turn-helix transcriptional regulator [Vibrio vulnificus]MCA3991426.1 helix-turn-helix transcriptional regulator [Vibrio vulnificus]MCA4001079.1 helix-turn-helix transcriptional regulator [Vibrio vulnificus]MCA4009787.1 helix-turn-helix transcriptional regulator [Vibrio vulnificus]MDK2609157.1 helix-turn-helix transcriptional regulator [Vibrio vulnificus]MDK2609696.1 helix-turn-helix transcriptional regulator [Vibrio vulnificus]
MVTAFGKFLRKLRVEQELVLREMAESLGVSSAQLSAMELGKRTIQPNLAKKIVDTYGVSSVQEVEQLIDVSQPTLKTDLTSGNDKQRETMIMFARAFDELSDDQLKSVQEIIMN